MTTSYLLDTNALSEPTKKQPDQGFMEWFMTTDELGLFTTCLVLGEIKKGITLLSDGKKQMKLEALLAEIIEGFDGRIVGADREVALLWGELAVTGKRSDKTPPVIDALIAAQCIAHDLTLVTRNVKDFEQFAKLKIYSPWST